MVVFHVINSLLKLLQYIIFHTNVKGDPISAPNNNTHAITVFNQLIINSIHQLGSRCVCLVQLVHCSLVQSNTPRDCLIRSKYRPARSHVPPVRLHHPCHKTDLMMVFTASGCIINANLFHSHFLNIGPTCLYQLSLADTDVHYT